MVQMGIRAMIFGFVGDDGSRSRLTRAFQYFTIQHPYDVASIFPLVKTG
jgi:hypothetical protein